MSQPAAQEPEACQIKSDNGYQNWVQPFISRDNSDGRPSDAIGRPVFIEWGCSSHNRWCSTAAEVLSSSPYQPGGFLEGACGASILTMELPSLVLNTLEVF